MEGSVIYWIVLHIWYIILYKTNKLKTKEKCHFIEIRWKLSPGQNFRVSGAPLLARLGRDQVLSWGGLNVILTCVLHSLNKSVRNVVPTAIYILTSYHRYLLLGVKEDKDLEVSAQSSKEEQLRLKHGAIKDEEKRTDNFAVKMLTHFYADPSWFRVAKSDIKETSFCLKIKSIY